MNLADACWDEQSADLPADELIPKIFVILADVQKSLHHQPELHGNLLSNEAYTFRTQRIRRKTCRGPATILALHTRYYMTIAASDFAVEIQFTAVEAVCWKNNEEQEENLC